MPAAADVLRKQLGEAVRVAGDEVRGLEITAEFVRNILTRGDRLVLEGLDVGLYWDGQVWRVWSKPAFTGGADATGTLKIARALPTDPEMRLASVGDRGDSER